MMVALTGGTGYLGRHVTQALTAAGHAVRLLVRQGNPQAANPATVADNLQIRVIDPTSVSDVASALQGCHAVVHAAAALTGDEATQHRITVEGTQTMLAAMHAAGVKRLVGISSLSVYAYADRPNGSVLNEDSPLEATPAVRDVYARCKLAQDALFRAFADQPGCAATVLRPGIFYDASSLWQFSLGKGLGRKAWVTMGPLTPDSEVPLVHVADVAQAIALAVSVQLPASANGAAVFNLVESPAPASRALLQALVASGPHPVLVRMPWALHLALARLAHALHRSGRGRLPLPGLLNPVWLAARFTRVHYDSARAQRLLGWQPAHNALADLAQCRAARPTAQ